MCKRSRNEAQPGSPGTHVASPPMLGDAADESVFDVDSRHQRQRPAARRRLVVASGADALLVSRNSARATSGNPVRGGGAAGQRPRSRGGLKSLKRRPQYGTGPDSAGHGVSIGSRCRTAPHDVGRQYATGPGPYSSLSAAAGSRSRRAYESREAPGRSSDFKPPPSRRKQQMLCLHLRSTASGNRFPRPPNSAGFATAGDQETCRCDRAVWRGLCSTGRGISVVRTSLFVEGREPGDPGGGCKVALEAWASNEVVSEQRVINQQAVQRRRQRQAALRASARGTA